MSPRRFIAAFVLGIGVAVASAAPAPAAAADSGVMLSVSKSAIPFRGQVTVTAHLATATGNPVVSIYRTPAGGTPELVATGSVDAGGDLTATVTLTRTAGFTAHWDGDSASAPADSATRAVQVHAAIAGAFVSPPYARHGSYRLFRYHGSCPVSGSGCVVWSVRIRPGHAGDAVTFVLQRRVSGSWRAIARLSQQLGSDSRARVRFRYGRAAVGTPLRFVARFGGDAANLGASTPFAYFRLTS
jgi:hypothetical protein